MFFLLRNKTCVCLTIYASCFFKKRTTTEGVNAANEKTFDIKQREESSPKLLDPWRFCDLAFMLYSPGVTHKRLITGMAPTCDWMIKIVKVNKLYLNSLLVSIVNRVSQSRTMKYQCEWKHRQEMVTYIAKGRQPFLFSEVVQRYSSDEKVICWLAPLTKFV